MDNDNVKRTVMFVDDEVNILSSLKRGLHKEEYNKIFVSSAKDALEELKKNEVEVLVTDMRMPQMNGLELMKIVEEKYPDIIKIVLSGYTQLPQILATINQVNIFKFITKPWDLEADFKRIIWEAIEFYNMKTDNIRLRTSIEKKNVLYQKLLKINDEKLKSSKNDSIVVNKCLGIILKYSKKYTSSIEVKDDIKSVLQNINFMEEIMSDVLSILPSSYKYFEFDYLEKDLNSVLKSNNDILDKYGEKEFLDSNIKFIPYSDIKLEKYKFYNPYKVLIIILKTILTRVYISRFDDEFYVTVKEKSVDANEYKLIFVISSKRNKINQDKLKVEFLREMLDSMITYYSGSVSIAKNLEKDVVILEFYLTSMSN
ncbi:MAG: response regulator [Acidaminobacteraceae bacterium]